MSDKLRVRVVKPKTTAELLDEWCAKNRMRGTAGPQKPAQSTPVKGQS